MHAFHFTKFIIVLFALSLIENNRGAAKTVTIQIPAAVTYTSPGSGSYGTYYNFILKDQATPPNPIANIVVQIGETYDSRVIYINSGYGLYLGDDTTTAQSSASFGGSSTVAFSGTTGGGGEFSDFVHMTAGAIVSANGDSSLSSNGYQAIETRTPMKHTYVNALYKGVVYTFTTALIQTQSDVITVTDTPTTVFGYVHNSWSSTSSSINP